MRLGRSVKPLDLTEPDRLIRKRLGVIVVCQVLWAFGFAGLGVCGARKSTPSFTERGSSQPVASGGKRALYYGTSHATGGSRWQRFGLFSALPRSRDLPLIATGCNHGAP